jgi:hypothetical protein
MDSFCQCVEDLGTIGRMLELPHGHDIASEMLRELSPYLKQLAAVSGRDPSGGVKLILDYAEGLRTRLRGSDPKDLKPAGAGRVEHVA